MKVKFTFDKKISYDGWNETTYLRGGVYESSHAKEEACFQQALNDGHALLYKEEVVEEAHPAKKGTKKVLTPKNKK
jgi:hypothetical protein